MGVKRVLIAEDHTDIRRLISVTLHRGGFEVIEAKDGDEALGLARSEHPDALVTDLLMPGRDGGDLVKTLRAEPEFAHLPVLVLTANPDHPAIGELRNLSQVKVMRKPPPWLEVVEMVRAMLRGPSEHVA
jgi:DNA-binding response OmpR family regulator